MKIAAIWLLWSVLAMWPVAALCDDLSDRSANIHKIVAALDATDLSANEIRSLKSYNGINVIDLSEFDSAYENQAIELALRDTDDGWAMVQTAIVANEKLKLELLRRSVAIRNIVAATMDDRETITIYVR
ncbi:hypothetical protein [Neoaquamicrobium sediminum]|jgi:hypothetical protein|uniref:Uncharacterized protein n=1 Tax=Neoaquamicrobium sediminum TaxID=1849104 RepID=A0ABV3X0B3_9HYPH|nr:hypothetical protein [Mesorhizobium sediminum]NRC56620.1 hypothetical protein [Mesorhizobium sediminum]